MRGLILVFALLFAWTTSVAPLTAQEVEEDWPMVVQSSDHKIVIYQPHPDSFEDNHLSGRAAIAVYLNGNDTPVFGAIWLEARVVCDRDNRMCAFENVKIPIIRFPESEDGTTDLQQLRVELESELQQVDYEISQDRLLASIEMAAEEAALAEDFDNQPPEIIFTETPSILVLIDGAPQVRDYPGNKKFRRVINTPFFIVRYQKNNRYYLFGDGQWFGSDELLHGWTYEARPPSPVRKLEKEIKREKQTADNPEPVTSDDLLGKPPNTAPLPNIIVRTQPTELIQSEGEPEFSPIEGTDLLYMSNTESLVFLNIKTQQYFFTVSGRWFTGQSIEGPWTYVPADELPDDFADIPEGSDRDMVLAYVAGTDAAKEAIVDAFIPETATVDRKGATTEVDYDGQPSFEPVPGTNLEYAVNTAATVLRSEGRYYCVDNGIWFVADAPEGPWSVAVERPAEVERIPPKSPVYNVKYVYIYDYTPDVVYVGYTPGYLGYYVYGPTVVYGTGWYYRPWYGTWYYPRHWTWGFHMQYHPWYGWSMSWSIGWGYPAGWFWPPYYMYRPPYYVYSPMYYGGWWGPGFYRPPVYYPSYHHGYYGPRRSTSYERPIPATGPRRLPETRPTNLYAQRRNQAVRANEVRRRTAVQERQARPQPAPRPVEQQPQTRPATRPDNDVYIDRNGNIYRRDKSGNWQRREDREWKTVPQTRPRTDPSRTEQTREFNRSQMERYNAERQRGSQRTQQYRTYQRRQVQPQTAPKKKGSSSPRKKN